MPYEGTRPSFGRQEFKMEGMVANNTGDYKGTNPRQFGTYLCWWRSISERIGCLKVEIPRI